MSDVSKNNLDAEASPVSPSLMAPLTAAGIAVLMVTGPSHAVLSAGRSVPGQAVPAAIGRLADGWAASSGGVEPVAPGVIGVVIALPERRDTKLVLLAAQSVCGIDQLKQWAEIVQAVLRGESRSTMLQRELESLSAQLADCYEELTLIYQLSSGMRVNRGHDDFFLQACTEVIKVMQVRSVGVMLLDQAGRVESHNIYGEVQLPPLVASQLCQDLLVRFRSAARPVLVNDVDSNPGTTFLAGQVQRLLAVPMLRQDRLLGGLVCFDKLGDDFNTTDSKLLGSLANESAIFLENANLFSDARGLMMGLLHALTSAVDAKDTYTHGHSQRVALYGKEITRMARLPDAFAERVYMAGLLHDVGKIGVPEEVLRKPGKLTEEELTAMKRHVEIGARILRDIKQIEDLTPGVLHHHERYDGKGYPHGLAGQDIPLIARILCVADCFDAMTSSRTYRDALPLEVALMEIRRCGGTQFDPTLADAFLQIGRDRIRELATSVHEDDTSLPRLQLKAA